MPSRAPTHPRDAPNAEDRADDSSRIDWSEAGGPRAVDDGPEVEVRAARYYADEVIASKYRLIRLLAEGGMGSVWLARNRVLEVNVAVKLIRRDFVDRDAAGLLLQEARAAARIEHPSIVRIFDFGTTEWSDPFIVMEVLDGESLGDVLFRCGRLPAPNAVQTLLPVVSGLVAAHARHFVHRDMKPDNIVLVTTESGAIIPKIVDFGIALTADTTRAQKRAFLGSPAYMAPEQILALDAIDERADIWAVAVVLYECIAGHRPFDGQDEEELYRAALEDVPTPTTAFGAGDDELWLIIERGLAKDPHARWPTMRELGVALAEWATTRGFDTDVSGIHIGEHWLYDEWMERGSRPPAWQSERLLVSRPRMVLSALGTPVPSPEAPAEDVSVAEVPTPVVPSAQPATPGAPRPMPRRGPLLWACTAVGLAFLAVILFRGLVEPETTAVARAGQEGERAPGLPPTRAPSAPRPMSSQPGSPTSAAMAAPSANVGACVARQLAPDAFGAAGPEIGRLCSETDARRGAMAIKAELVRGSAGRVTEAMREWSVLSWYEMAEFAAIRARCCVDAPPLALTPPIGSCEPLDRRLDDLGRAAAAGADADEALARYTKAVNCTVSSGVASMYPYRGRPRGGEEQAFRRALARMASPQR